MMTLPEQHYACWCRVQVRIEQLQNRYRRGMRDHSASPDGSSGRTSGRPQLPHCLEKTFAGAPTPEKNDSPHRGHLNDASRETLSTLKISAIPVPEMTHSMIWWTSSLKPIAYAIAPPPTIPTKNVLT